MQENTITVPLLRQCVGEPSQDETADSQVSKGPARISVVIFLGIVFLSLLMRFATGSNETFLLGTILAFGCSAVTYVVGKNQAKKQPFARQRHELLHCYGPILGLLSASGFGRAAELAQEILEIALVIRKNRIEIFDKIDDAFQLLLAKLVSISTSKRSVGTERDLSAQSELLEKAIVRGGTEFRKNHADTLRNEMGDLQRRLDTLEAINLVGLALTEELQSLQRECLAALRESDSAYSQKIGSIRDAMRDREQRVESLFTRYSWIV